MPLQPLSIVWILGLATHRISSADMVRQVRDVGGHLQIAGWAPPRIGYAHVEWPAKPWRLSLPERDGTAPDVYHEVLTFARWADVLAAGKRCSRRGIYAVLEGDDWKPSADVTLASIRRG
jgi:hypothetical protein